jgi:hypothetical protein
MDVSYLIGCCLIALFLPHLTDESVAIGHQVLLQVAFISVGLIGYKTFNT